MGTQAGIVARDSIALNECIEPAWYAVHTSSRHEKQVAQHFESRSISYLLPMYEEVHRWTDRRVSVRLPLFPGYIFVRIAISSRGNVLRVPGVVRLVGFGGVPVPLDGGEIEALQRGSESGVRIEPHPFLTVGRRVRIRGGALAGMEGVLLRKKDGFRVVISVELIMRSVCVEVDAADLQVL